MEKDSCVTLASMVLEGLLKCFLCVDLFCFFFRLKNPQLGTESQMTKKASPECHCF